jgi:chemotaxis protein CheD
MLNAKQSLQQDSSLPPVLPGFRNINRYWDPKLNIHIAKIQPGEYYVGNQIEGISTVLGSCVAVCIRDRQARVGGMNHFMLPLDASQGVNKLLSNSTRYGNYAMEHLLNDIFKHGGRKENLEIKLFGGANVNSSSSNVGARNIEFAQEFFRVEGYELAAQDVGGNHPRKILYYPIDGKLLLKRLPITENKSISSIEKKYNHSIDKAPVGGEVDLF